MSANPVPDAKSAAHAEALFTRQAFQTQNRQRKNFNVGKINLFLHFFLKFKRAPDPCGFPKPNWQYFRFFILFKSASIEFKCKFQEFWAIV